MKEEGGDEDAEPRTLIVRAQDGETIMGEDLVLPVTGDETVVQIQEVRYPLIDRVNRRIQETGYAPHVW